jgi:hypothetical protein
MRAPWIGPVALLALLACSGRDRADAVQVLSALQRVRDAPKEAKGPAAEALARVQCANPIVCAARDKCAEVYRHFAEGMRAHARVATEIDKLAVGPPVAAQRRAELGAGLDRAATEVNEAEKGLPGCEQAASLMRRRYGI